MKHKMKKTLEACETSESVFTAFLEAHWELWTGWNYCKVGAKHIRKVVGQYFTDRMELYLQGSVLFQVQVNVVINVLLEG